MPFLPSRRKGLGARIEGLRDTRTFGLELLRLGDVPASVTEFSLEPFIPKVDGQPVVLNQGATSSCVAHAFVAGIHIAETRAGLPYSPCSRLFAYYNARREQGDVIVTDSGTFLRTCAAGLFHMGVPDERYWEFSEFTLRVNKRPSYDAIRHAQPRAGGKYVKVYQQGLKRVDAIKQALYAGHAVSFGTEVSESFLDNAGDPYILRDYGAVAGGHALLIIGWKTVEGVTWFRVLNSWGNQWRDKGLCWFHQERVGSVSADDFHVVYGWNRIQQAKVP